MRRLQQLFLAIVAVGIVFLATAGPALAGIGTVPTKPPVP